MPLLLEILSNRCILITSFPVDDVINFEISISFLIKAFSYMSKKSQDKKFLQKKEKRLDKIKSIFHHFHPTRSDPGQREQIY